MTSSRFPQATSSVEIFHSGRMLIFNNDIFKHVCSSWCLGTKVEVSAAPRVADRSKHRRSIHRAVVRK